jgi:hypothetical protein
MDDCAAHSYMDSGLVAGRGYLIILVFFSRAYVASAEFFEVCGVGVSLGDLKSMFARIPFHVIYILTVE